MYKKYFLLGLIYLAWGWYMVLPDEEVKVIFCDVGQGDAAIVSSGYFQMLIDTGGPRGNVEKCLGDNLPLGDKRIEVVILSHLDSDHSGGLENIKKYYQVDKIVGLGELNYGDVVWGNNFKFKVVFPDFGLSQRPNDSVVGILEFDQKRILFTGDIDELVENSIIDRIELPIDVVKMSHHGSDTGNSKSWLQKINANTAVISVGKNNYGHPNLEVITRVLDMGTSVLRTDDNGSMIID